MQVLTVGEVVRVCGVVRSGLGLVTGPVRAAGG